MAIGASALMIGGGAFSAVSSAMAGQAEASNIQKQAEYNAQIYEQQAEMIQQKKKISEYQFNREAAFARGSVVASTAGKGFFLSGSPMAILIDNESQMQFDKAVNDYNLDVERNYAMSGATNTRAQGASQASAAKMAGYTNAFRTMLSLGANRGLSSFGSTGTSTNPFLTIDQVRMGSTYRGGAV